MAAEPLHWITEHLRQQVKSFKMLARSLFSRRRAWEITLDNGSIITANNVIKAMGAIPKTLHHPNITEIPVTIAMDPELLPLHCDPEDTIAVFGASHSAIIIIRTLLEQCKVKRVVNFYRDALRYAVYYDDWILFDDTGLKGQTAAWAR